MIQYRENCCSTFSGVSVTLYTRGCSAPADFDESIRDGGCTSSFSDTERAQIAGFGFTVKCLYLIYCEIHVHVHAYPRAVP